MASASEALREAWASAKADVFPVRTVELLHPAFVDESDAPDSIRGALDDRSWTLTLEDAAPLKGGEAVVFEPIALEIQLPEHSEGNFGEARLSIDNVPNKYLAHIERAVSVRATALLIYREWLAVRDQETGLYSASGGPDLIAGELSIKRLKVTRQRITGTARFLDLVNKGFPLRTFSREHFPGLF